MHTRRHQTREGGRLGTFAFAAFKVDPYCWFLDGLVVDWAGEYPFACMYPACCFTGVPDLDGTGEDLAEDVVILEAWWGGVEKADTGVWGW